MDQLEPELLSRQPQQIAGVVTVDELLEKHQIKTVNVIQIDAEGHDYEILACFDADAIHRPLGLTATALISALWAASIVTITVPFFHSVSAPLRAPVTSCSSSGHFGSRTFDI